MYVEPGTSEFPTKQRQHVYCIFVKMTDSEENKKVLFRDIDADDDDPEVTEIESLCINCHEQVGIANSQTGPDHWDLTVPRQDSLRFKSLVFNFVAAAAHRIFPKYLDILAPYHTWPKVWTQFDNLKYFPG